MKITNNLTSVTLLLSILFCLTGRGLAESYSAEELQQRAIHRRAVEAVIWGMPAVNYERMLHAAIDNGAKLNQVVYWSRPVNWKNQTLTPNPDTIYLNPFYDTTARPGGGGDPSGRRRPRDRGQLRRGLAERAGRRRPCRRGQGKGRQVSHHAAGV